MYIKDLMKELLYQLTVRAGRRENSQALLANAWHHRSDALSSIPVAISVILAKIYPDIKYVAVPASGRPLPGPSVPVCGRSTTPKAPTASPSASS